MNPSDEPKPRLREGALIAGSIVAAAFIVSWGMSNAAPRYEIAGAGDTVVRMNTDSGELIACGPQGCRRILQPDRAKTLGAIGIEVGDPNNRLPARPEQNDSNGR